MARSLDVEQCRALEMLARTPRGISEDLLVLGYDFNINVIAGLVSASLATAQRETIRVSDRTTDVIRVSITEAGREALKAC